MKNETISRLILVLEIAAIILFHSFKSNAPTDEKVVRHFSDPASLTFPESSQVILTKAP